MMPVAFDGGEMTAVELDFKRVIDLGDKRQEVELARDVGGLLVRGGYILAGIGPDARPTGDMDGMDLTLSMRSANRWGSRSRRCRPGKKASRSTRSRERPDATALEDRARLAGSGST